MNEETNIEKKTPKSSVQNIGKKEDEIRYEAQFELSTDFGSVGAVTIENEQQEEVFLKSIVLHGFPDIGHVHFTCNSWIQPKHDGAMKRVFFTDKVRIIKFCILNIFPFMENSFRLIQL